MFKILVCDDDKEIVEAIEIYLTQEGYEVLKAYDGEEAIQTLKKEHVDLLIMDVMMPRLDGIRATLKIREENSLPIIILSAKSEDADKILGLNIGADDYVTKPFNPLELVARAKSQLRRYTQLGSTVQDEKKEVYEVGGLSINDELKEVTVDGESVRLTPIEYNILLLLVKNQGKVFSIDQIYENIWNEEAIGADNISKVLDVELSSFFNMSDTANDLHIVRRYEQKSTIVNPEIVEYSLTNNITDFDLLPRLVELMPALQKEDELELYTHGGEEFIYILEGILTLQIGSDIYNLYPGDSAHIHSNISHNWKNDSNAVTRFLTVHTPNPFQHP